MSSNARENDKGSATVGRDTFQMADSDIVSLSSQSSHVAQSSCDAVVIFYASAAHWITKTDLCGPCRLRSTSSYLQGTGGRRIGLYPVCYRVCNGSASGIALLYS
jgi:hypothetical protein